MFITFAVKPDSSKADNENIAYMGFLVLLKRFNLGDKCFALMGQSRRVKHDM